MLWRDGRERKGREQKRRISCEKRPMSYEKRPMSCEKRSMFYGKRPTKETQRNLYTLGHMPLCVEERWMREIR